MMALSGNRARIVCMALATLAPSLPIEAAPDPEAKPADMMPRRTDSYGDPLPDGVLVRLGSVRWRHAGDVHQIAFSPDGSSIVSCSADGWVHRSEAATGKRLWHFRAARAADPTALSSSPAVLSADGRVLATVVQSQDGKSDKVVLWRTATGKAFREFKGDGLFSQLSSGSLAFSADGKILATGSSKGVLRLFDTDTGRERRSLRWDEWEISSLAFSTDGKMLAATSFGGVAVWTVAEGACPRTFSAPKEERMTAVAFAPDGKTLATGTRQGTLQIWDLATGKKLHTLRDPKREEPRWYLHLTFLLFSPNGSLLAMGDPHNGEVLLWNTATGKVVRKIEDIAEPLCASFSPDGKTLATGDSTNRVRLWDVASGKERNPRDDNAVAFAAPALSPDGRILATFGGDRTIRLWSFPSGKPLRTFRGHDSGVLCLVFSADGQQLITGSYDGTLRFHDAVSGRQLRNIDAHGRSEQGKREAFAVRALALSPDGKTLASGGFDSRVRLWDVATGKLRHVLDGRRGWVFSVAFSPDGKIIAGGGATDDSCDTCLWNTASGKRVGRLKEDGGAAKTLAFSPDGKVLVAAGELLGYWHIDFVEAATGKALARFDNRETAVLDSYVTSAISSDGRILALGGYRGVSLWEMASRRPIGKLRGEWGGCSHLVLTEDGRVLIGANGDGTIHFWDLTGRADGDRLRGGPLSAKALEELWARLESAGPAPAYRALWTLAAAPDDAVPFLSRRLRPIPRLDPPKVKQLLTDLSSDQFVVREKAAKKLAEFQEGALPALREALAAHPDLQTRKRLELLVHQAEKGSGEPSCLRPWRALAALEQMRAHPARRLLETLAAGVPEAWLTREAKASLRRLSRRAAARP